ncbi:MAG: VPLPA-CTERM-specific exosortase XrtD [Paracoccus sp. (in: a-proteobacteria)]|uniref:VPLPA-CTERM-specific exosortase XrtD n=1 Tax=Paracoccus sp. TaxID=267 RepID=UPI0026DF4A46|nr:VPLPA-CTERM-specific exosortase XrtD [Paracoccus sp. (in: a-proteobacteria)]MDO5612140.1 VPLPA-CTERM-specific exosortase XrtD [Paracoccus sp. (in: a-proteobacteria)]
MTETTAPRSSFALSDWLRPGLLWLAISCVAALAFFSDGVTALLRAWQLPEYSHGPLIPVLSALLFLRQLKEEPVRDGPVTDRWPGVVLLIVAMLFGALGTLSGIDDLVAYALILWVGAVLLISFGWSQGKAFWPPVLHLVYMLPLPGVLYFKMSTWLQLISSELGVFFLRLIDVPVFLEGNIIDLGVYKLHVAEACSGLRYLFPILSFSYIFAVLYRGPVWHKAVLLLAAAPITVLMNSVRIAFAGWIVNYVGLEHLEGFTHFFEGWVVFLLCVLMLFLLAWVLLFLRRDRLSLVDALDLNTAGLGTQFSRLRLIEPSKALIAATALLIAGAVAVQMRPEVQTIQVDRTPLTLFPTRIGEWRSDGPTPLDPAIARSLAADDYISASYIHPDSSAPVQFFSAYYYDQSKGGIHSPEICLPGSGWEIAWLQREDIAPQLGLDQPFNLNRAIIQQGNTRMMVYYWFEQHGRRTAWDFAAKMWLLWDAITIQRTDGALVRIITPINHGETDQQAEARLQQMLKDSLPLLPRYIPEA